MRATETTANPTSAGRPLRLAAMLGAGVVAVTIASGADAHPQEYDVESGALPEAATWTERGAASEFTDEAGTVRVRAVLRSQPLLAAASTNRFQRFIRSRSGSVVQAAAQTRPRRISTVEKKVARGSEVRYEKALSQLADESAESAGDLTKVATAIRRGGGTVLRREVVPASVTARIDLSELDEIRSILGVQAVERAPFESPLSDNSVPAVGAPAWWAAGFTGGTGPNDVPPAGDGLGADVAVQSEAPDATHPAFANVTVDNSPVNVVDDHGTHVSGVIASNDTTYRGVAYGVDRLIGAHNSSYALGITDGSGIPGAADPAEAINRSFGSFAVDDDEDTGTDVLTHLFGLARAEGAGNDNTTGAPTVGNIGRNYLNVGAFNDVNTTTSTDDVVLGVSSRGPTPGGRKKPDLTAPGGSIQAPDAQWETGPDFTGASGTSFSTPHVAGALALLEGSGISDGMGQRALLINSARDWNGTNTGLAGWTAPQTGWRPEVGWGSLDLTSALAQRGNFELGEVAEGEAAFYRATVPAGAKATMAFELRGFFIGFPQNGTQTITYTQSNLDLHQYESDGDEIAAPPAFDPPNTTIDPGPDAVDPNDTVEQVRAPSAQTITYKVEAASEVDGAAAEPFALATATPLQELGTPLTRPVGSAASPSGAVNCSTPVTVTSTFDNPSADLNSTSSTAKIELPVGVELVAGSQQTQTVSGGTLTPSDPPEQKSWTVMATSDGPKVITVAGEGRGLGTLFRRIEIVEIDVDCTAPETIYDTGPANLGNDPTPSFFFSATGGATGFECSIDGGAFVACSSGFTAASLGDGTHTFAVRASDGVGNTDVTPASRVFTIDTVPPDTRITGGPSGPTAAADVRFLFDSPDDAAGFECALDERGFTPCESPLATDSRGSAAHIFTVRAVDGAGNRDPSPASRSYVLDFTVSNVKLAGERRQRFAGSQGPRISLRAGEPAVVTVAATVLAGKRPKLRAPPLDLEASKRVQLRLRGSPAINRLILKLLKRRDRLKLSVRATFIDELGNRAVRRRPIELR